MRVGRHQGYRAVAGQAAGDQVAEEGQPPGCGFGCCDMDPEDLPVPVGVDAGGHQDGDLDHPATFADLHRQRVGRDECVRPVVQRPSPERFDLAVEVLGHLADLRLRQSGDPQRADQFVHPPGGHPEQVAGSHHRRQRRLSPPAALQQPLREEGALPQLRDRDIDRADPGVQVSMPVAVAAVGPLRAPDPVPGATHTVGLRRQQRVDERSEQLAHQVRAGLRQLLIQEPGRVDTGSDGHRDAPFESAVEGSLEGSPGDRHPHLQRHAHRLLIHHPAGLNLGRMIGLATRHF